MALALVEECTLPVGELVTAKAPLGRLDKSPQMALLLPVVTESPADMTLDVTVLCDEAGTRPPVVVVE